MRLPSVSVLSALLLLTSAPTQGRTPKPREAPKQGALGVHKPHSRLAFVVDHLPTRPCGGLCGLSMGKLNRLRFTLVNKSREHLQVGWRYSCSGFSNLSVAVYGPKRGKALLTHAFGNRRVCSRNGLMLRPMGPNKSTSASRSVDLDWTLPLRLSSGRKLRPGLHRLVATISVMERRANNETKHVALRAERMIPIHY